MEAFRVLVRCKPSLNPVVQVSPGQVNIPEMRGLCRAHNFDFEHVFVGSTAELYIEGVQMQVRRLATGRNCTCLAYGATGSGKTYTMFGSLYHQTVSEAGVVALALKDALEMLERPTLSYLEVYNERVNDLLGREESLTLHEDARGMTVLGLTAIPVTDYETALELVKQGNSKRKQAQTKAHAHSSRSHAMLTLTSQNTKLHLLDLAGSERAQNELVRAAESGCINKSLLTLGNCITALACHKGAFVPYRDSKLTRLLKDSLGGETLTIFIACVTPTAAALDETLQTLKYAYRAQRVQVKENKEDRLQTQRRILVELQECTANRREHCKDEVPFLLRVSDSLKQQVAMLDRLLGKENCTPEKKLRQQLQQAEHLGAEKDRVIAALAREVQSLRVPLQPRSVETSPLRLRLSSLAALRRAHKEAKCLGRSQSLGGLN